MDEQETQPVAPAPEEQTTPAEVTPPAGPVSETNDPAVEPAPEAAPEEPAAVAEPERHKRYRGLRVIDERPRTVESRTFTHIRLEDGQELDLTEQEYTYEVHETLEA